MREPRINVGIKATKWNGIWLDIPGDQFSHSDIHVLVKVGVGRDHLFAFFKEISVFRDKVLKCGMQAGCLDQDEADTIFNNIPSFAPIPAYISGFVPRDSEYADLSYAGKKGRIHYKIKSWNGPKRPGDLERIKNLEGVSGNVNFEGIQKFSHESGHLFNTGSLLWEESAWVQVIERI